MKNSIALFLVTAALLVSATASVQADETDRLVLSIMKERKIPGASVAVIRGGRTIKQGGYGRASLEFGAPVMPGTVFEIGSVSKQITAGAVMMLVEQGKVDLDAKISTYLPGTPESWKDVTVRSLLNHTSGIRNYNSLQGFELSRRLTREAFIGNLGTVPLDFPTGTKYSYSNSGYSLLGYVIEAASGVGYWEFLRTRIFTPLRMEKSGDRDPRFIVRNRATGYEWEDAAYAGRDWDLTDLFAAGAIVSTIGDMVKWEASLRNALLLKRDSLMQMWTPTKLADGTTYPYGLGFRLSDIRGTRLVAHSGQTAGFGANISRYVDDDLTVIALTNLGEQGMGTLIAESVAKIYLPKLSLSVLKAVPGEDRTVTARVTSAMKARFEGTPGTDIFTDDMLKSLSTERTKVRDGRLAPIIKDAVPMFIGRDTSRADGGVRYLFKSKDRMFLWRFTFAADGKVSGMALEEEEMRRGR